MRLPAREGAIALVLVEALEPTGWLAADMTRLARICGADPAEIEAVLERLQGLEPAGIFARSLAECLRLQARAEGVLSPAMAAVLDHLPLLASGDLAQIACLSGQPQKELHLAAGLLRGFDPKPGLAFADYQPPVPPPDFVLTPGPTGWTVMSDPHAPMIEVTCEKGDAAARDLRDALARRARTGRAVCDFLVARQRPWLDGGDPVAVTTRDVAKALDLHVATVNRVLGAFVLRGPHGTAPLRALIAPPLRSGGPPISLARTRLAEFLARPECAGWSDRRLAEALTDDGIPIARRTVTKYRAALAAG